MTSKPPELSNHGSSPIDIGTAVSSDHVRHSDTSGASLVYATPCPVFIILSMVAAPCP